MLATESGEICTFFLDHFVRHMSLANVMKGKHGPVLFDLFQSKMSINIDVVTLTLSEEFVYCPQINVVVPLRPRQDSKCIQGSHVIDEYTPGP